MRFQGAPSRPTLWTFTGLEARFTATYLASSAGNLDAGSCQFGHAHTKFDMSARDKRRGYRHEAENVSGETGGVAEGQHACPTCR